MAKQVITKGSLLSIGTVLVSVGIGMFTEDQLWAGVAVVALGVICVFGREIFKRFDRTHKEE